MPSDTPYRVLPDENLSVSISNSEIQDLEANKFGSAPKTIFWLYWPCYIFLAIILGDHPPGIIWAMFGAVPFAIISYFPFREYYRKPRLERLKQELISMKRDRELAKRSQEAKSVSASLATLWASSLEFPAALSRRLNDASLALETARREFADNAFDPFWSAVETAAEQLGEFDRLLNRISSNAKKYHTLLAGRKHTFPIFPFGLDSLPDSTAIIEEFRAVIRMGQTNFQFANIWEHRKTRAVLIAGFRTLGDAVNNLSSVVQREISLLRDTLHSDLAQIVEEEIMTRETLERSLDQQIKTTDLLTRSADDQDRIRKQLRKS